MKIKQLFSSIITVTLSATLLCASIYSTDVSSNLNYAPDQISQNDISNSNAYYDVASIYEEEFDSDSDVIQDVTEISTAISNENLISYVQSPANTTTYGINWTINPYSTSMGSSQYDMIVGDTISFNLNVTPSYANINVGVLTPRNTFRSYNVTNGSLNSTMSMIDNGMHKFRVVNNSGYTVTLSGTFTVTSSADSEYEYMFKEPYMATYISSKYGYRGSEFHKGFDITTGDPGIVNGYPVYSIAAGEVVLSDEFSDGTTCVAIKNTSDDYTVRYLHMNNDENINDGTMVVSGTQVGTVSDNGSSGSYHLHLDVNTADTAYGSTLDSSNTVNPVLLFPNINFSGEVS